MGLAKPIAALSTIVFLANSLEAAERLPSVMRTYSSRDGNDSVVTYFREKHGDEIWYKHSVNGRIRRVRSDGTIVGGGIERKSGSYVTVTHPNGTVVNSVETVLGDNQRKNPEPQPAGSDGSDIIEVRVDGYSFGQKGPSNLEEATVDAYRKAIEKGTGMSIASFTTVENFMLKKDQITSKAKGLLVPGFEVVEIGYGPEDSNQIWNNGVYKVTLIGKVKADKSSEKARTEFEKGQDCYSQEDYDCAKLYFEKAVSLDKNNSQYWNRLGDAYRRLGADFFDKAIKKYYNCLAINPDDGNAYAGLAYIFVNRDSKFRDKEKYHDALKKGAGLGDPYCIKYLGNFEKIWRNESLSN
ncbi:tetratricopeptide repeat protein [Candidatus Woesearchaeota archaeon]|nr:tetratricopeptide repeat protein [Candidatus Woesearchaeota archaeon]